MRSFRVDVIATPSAAIVVFRGICAEATSATVVCRQSFFCHDNPPLPASKCLQTLMRVIHTIVIDDSVRTCWSRTKRAPHTTFIISHFSGFVKPFCAPKVPRMYVRKRHIPGARGFAPSNPCSSCQICCKKGTARAVPLPAPRLRRPGSVLRSALFLQLGVVFAVFTVDLPRTDALHSANVLAIAFPDV